MQVQLHITLFFFWELLPLGVAQMPTDENMSIMWDEIR
jgi:hypothetical protein